MRDLRFILAGQSDFRRCRHGQLRSWTLPTANSFPGRFHFLPCFIGQFGQPPSFPQQLPDSFLREWLALAQHHHTSREPDIEFVPGVNAGHLPDSQGNHRLAFAGDFGKREVRLALPWVSVKRTSLWFCKPMSRPKISWHGQPCKRPSLTSFPTAALARGQSRPITGSGAS